MKYQFNIDQTSLVEWGIKIQEAVVFDWLTTLPYWADSIIHNGKTYYWASKNKACDDLPGLTTKRDTIYRYYKGLEAVGVIELIKVEGKDYIAFKEKAALWGRKRTSEHSDKYPSELGQTSEKDSDKNPTYYNTINDNNTRDKDQPAADLFPNEPNPNKKTLFRNSAVSRIEIFKGRFKEDFYQQIDLSYYFNAIQDWSDTKNMKRTGAGWVATARQWMRRDKEKGELKLINRVNGGEKELTAEQIDFLIEREDF